MGCCCGKEEEVPIQRAKEPGLKPLMGGNCKLEEEEEETDTTVSGPKKVNIFTFSVRAKPRKAKGEAPDNKTDDTSGPQNMNLGRVVLIPTGTMVQANNRQSARKARFSHKRDESAAKPDKRRQELVHEAIYKMGGFINDKKGNRVYIKPGTAYPGAGQTLTPNKAQHGSSEEDEDNQSQ